MCQFGPVLVNQVTPKNTAPTRYTKPVTQYFDCFHPFHFDTAVVSLGPNVLIACRHRDWQNDSQLLS
jgi:hypothetical protein